ncbi:MULTISPECIES: EFR1 family ferrodoxin [unclassified Carboxylicivirga]|uniref:EFR1 family ferrodoxin n=1 Tax=Carboxylicivirga TaxID=1628153 RepID=UPI003D341F09
MKSITSIYYSPTQTTKTIVNEIAGNIGLPHIHEMNLIRGKQEALQDLPGDRLTIIGLPVYAGRLPRPALENLKLLKGHQSPVVIVVVYGNRDYEDALLELNDIVHNAGFKVIAGAAFIGEHSYSTNEMPIAPNRPDEADLKKCKDFANLIKKKLKETAVWKEPAIQGNYPYKPYKQMPATVHPYTDHSRCTQCGICLDACPTDAITIGETVDTNGELCTVCCACTRYCPEQARILDNARIDEIRERLYTHCSERKEPEFFV